MEVEANTNAERELKAEAKLPWRPRRKEKGEHDFYYVSLLCAYHFSNYHSLCLCNWKGQGSVTDTGNRDDDEKR